jgi:hypothetical protein
MATAPVLSDPILSASIYAGGLLDDLLTEVINPFQREARKVFGESFALWIVRYSSGGEHLKVRIHAELAEEPLARQMLGDRVQSYFDALYGPPAPPRKTPLLDLPAIDAEDDVAIHKSDRSWLWTTYRRSPVIMASPWLMSDEFADRTYNCMAGACEWVLSLYDAGSCRTAASARRLLICAVLLALRALQLHSADEITAYLSYHRDWLLRFLFPDAEGQAAVLQQFSRESGRRGAALEQIRRLTPSAGQGRDFAAALTDLTSYLGRVSTFISRDADPFASDMRFPPVFKVMHNLANQSGIRPLEEACLYHLVLTAIAPSRELARVSTGVMS